MVTSKLVRLKTARCLPVVLAALLFAGCSTQSPDQSTALLQAGATADSGYYLKQMQQSANDSKTTWQLLAIRALLNEGKAAPAAELYAQLPATLTAPQALEATLLGAEVKLAQNDRRGSQAQLAKLDPKMLDNQQQARYWQAIIALQNNQPSLALLRALVAQEPLLNDKAKQQNIDATWQALTRLNAQQLATMTINADENTLQGWLDLRLMWQENRSDANMLKAGIEDWQHRYPQNPGAKMLPAQLTGAQNYQPASVNTIALLLPLSGQAGTFGKIIQQGFDDARLHGTPAAAVAENTADGVIPVSLPASSPTTVTDSNAVASPAQAPVDDLTPDSSNGTQASEQTVPSTSAIPASASGEQTTGPAAANPGVQVKVYDTSSLPVSQLLAQAQQDGASLVVGPLLKNNVEQLPNTGSHLNILALNQPEQVQNHANICYFALSPEDEARDAARHIWQEGKRQPLLLLPSGDLGVRVANAFSGEWHKLGGSTVLAQRFGSVTDLKAAINSNSGIALTGIPVNDAAMPAAVVNTQGVPTPALEAVSGSVDAAYIVATRDELALIKPMITMRTGSQSKATLYASSRSAQGGAGADYRLEMEGVEFSDIPLLAGSNPTLLQQALQASNNNFALARLYAMGVDAWTLANHFAQIRQVPGFQISGNTGMLTPDADCVITRKLTWLKFQQGRIIPVS